MEIAAIILAAGKGSRIGMPKWQLLHHGKTFLEIITDNLFAAGINKVICVARADSVPPQDSRMLMAINPKPECGMLSSIYYGIAAAATNYPDIIGYLIMPVDHPFVQVDTLLKLREAFVNDPNHVIVPRCNDRSGHPIIIPKVHAKNMDLSIFSDTLRDFLQKQAAEIIHVDVADQGVLRNINVAFDLIL